MFESATVTISYLELTNLINENNKLKDEVNKYVMGDKEFEENKYVKCLDEIEKQLSMASKCLKAKDKQFYINLSIDKYCDVFNIPREELN